MKKIENVILENIIPYAPGYAYFDTMSDRIYRDEADVVATISGMTEEDKRVLNLDFEQGMSQKEIEEKYFKTLEKAEDQHNLIEMYKLSFELINDVIPKAFKQLIDEPGDHFLKKGAFIHELKDYFMMTLEQEMLLYQTLD